MTQEDEVHEYLVSGHTLTRLEALEKFHTFELPRIVYDLKSMGVDIKTKPETNGRKRWVRYFI